MLQMFQNCFGAQIAAVRPRLAHGPPTVARASPTVQTHTHIDAQRVGAVCPGVQHQRGAIELQDLHGLDMAHDTAVEAHLGAGAHLAGQDGPAQVEGVEVGADAAREAGGEKVVHSHTRNMYLSIYISHICIYIYMYTYIHV